MTAANRPLRVGQCQRLAAVLKLRRRRISCSTELMPLIERRAITITVAALNEGSIRVDVIPAALAEDSKANGNVPGRHSLKSHYCGLDGQYLLKETVEAVAIMCSMACPSGYISFGDNIADKFEVQATARIFAPMGR